MPSVDRLPSSGILYDYRGQRYEQHSPDPDRVYERRLRLEPEWRREDLPHHATFGGDPDDPWVSIAAGLIEAAWLQTVHGVWHGCPVTVGRPARVGPDRGRLTVRYAGRDPAQARAAGFIEDPYQYWLAIVDPVQVEVTGVNLERLPTV